MVLHALAMKENGQISLNTYNFVKSTNICNMFSFDLFLHCDWLIDTLWRPFTDRGSASELLDPYLILTTGIFKIARILFSVGFQGVWSEIIGALVCGSPWRSFSTTDLLSMCRKRQVHRKPLVSLSPILERKTQDQIWGETHLRL